MTTSQKPAPIHLSIQGMSCMSCVGHVERALRAVPGVADVHVDLKSARATVEGSVESSALVQAISEAGYTAQAL